VHNGFLPRLDRVRVSSAGPVKKYRRELLSNPLDKANEKSKKTIEILIKTGFLSEEKNFDISEFLLKEAIRVYGLMSPGGNKKFSFGYARKIWGINLLRLKISRGATYRECKEGLVYLIGNHAWPEYLKIGMTIDTEARLDSYQTYDPLRRYYIKHYEFCRNRKSAEKELLKKFNLHVVRGEWIKFSDSIRVIETIRKY